MNTTKGFFVNQSPYDGGIILTHGRQLAKLSRSGYNHNKGSGGDFALFMTKQSGGVRLFCDRSGAWADASLRDIPESVIGTFLNA